MGNKSGVPHIPLFLYFGSGVTEPNLGSTFECMHSEEYSDCYKGVVRVQGHGTGVWRN